MWLALAIAVTSALGVTPSSGPDAPLDAVGIPSFTGANGSRGLYRVDTAEAPGSNELVLGISGEVFQASGFLVSGDTDRFVGAHLVLSYSPLDLVTVWGSWSMASNSNDQLAPRSTGYWGDPTLGAKLRLALGPQLDAGVVLSVMIPTSAGGHGLDPGAAVVESRAVVSYAAARGVVLAANAGYVVDRSGELLGRDVGPQERFTAGVYGVNSVSLGVGAQALRDVSPALTAGGFVEVTANLPTARSGNPSPVRATLGVKALAPPARSVELALGTDVRLAGAPRENGTLPGIPPWQVFLRVAGHWPPRGAACDGEACVASGGGAATFRVAGKVVDRTSGAPVAQARITVSGLEPSSVSVQPGTGAFEVGPIPADGGLVQLKAEAAGYNPARQTLAKGPAGSVKRVTIELVPLAAQVPAVLKGIIIDAATGRPVRALVSIAALGKKIRAEPDGSFRIELEAGTYDVGISDPGHLPQAKTVELRPGDVVILNLDMSPRR